MANATRRYAVSHATEGRAHFEADSCIEAAIAYAETCACDGDEFDVTVNDVETGRGFTFKLDLSQNV
jgi:hypothetical protein